MSLAIKLRTLVLRGLLEPSVRRFLVSRMSRDETGKTLEAVWRGYSESAPSIPKGEGFGPTQVLHLAAITIALHQALTDSGRSCEAATEIVVDVGWVVYRKMGAVAWVLARTAGEDKFRRMRAATQIFRRFPFSSPAYQWKEIALNRTWSHLIAYVVQRHNTSHRRIDRPSASGRFAIWIFRSRRTGEPSLNEMDLSQVERNAAISDGGTAQSFRHEYRVPYCS